LGRNGTGKSTLLALVASVASSDFSQFKSEPFDLAYELEGPSGTVVIQIKNIAKTDQTGEMPHHLKALLSPSFETIVHISGHGEPPCDVVLQSPESTATVGNQTTRFPTPSAVLDGPLWLKLFRARNSHDPIRRLAINLVCETERFDESLEYFGRISQAYIHSLRSDESAPSTYSGALPREFMPELLRQLAGPDADRLEVDDRNSRLLADMKELLQFKAARLTLSLLESEMQGPQKLAQYGDAKVTFTRNDGTQITHPLLSYGQKRLIAFLYYIGATDSIVVADELVNGLHHEWIDACMERTADRQTFLTSQNPLLMDFLTLKSAEDAMAMFIKCTTDGDGRMVWNRMSMPVALDLFESYEQGFQHIGELLRDKGLW
jgi:hypothetical protein